MLGYQHQDNAQTLREGLAEYHAAHPGLKRGPALTTDGAAFFARHDAVHVLWGCGTSLPHEAIVKLSSFFGTSGGLGVMKGYLLYDSQDIYRALPFGETLHTILIAPYLVPRTIARCMAQKQKWPWDGFEALLDRPLDALRREYGIKVAMRGASAPARSSARPSRTPQT